MPLIPPQIRKLVATLGAAMAAIAFGTAVQAQAPNAQCQRYRFELANLSDGANTARALQNEIGRLEAYYRTLSCEGGKFLFFDSRPPQCGAVEQRIRALQAGYGAENGEVTAARRRQLTAAIASSCADSGPKIVEGVTGEQRGRGGPQVVCVRTCDGAYFPMNNLPDGREGANELCQALCPGTEAVAYSMPHGDDALKQAASVKGSRAYVSLANAFKFQKSFTPDCSCKKANQTWAQSLVKAESMLVRHKGDIFVTPMQAEAMSRPKVRVTLAGRADKTAAILAADAANRNGAVVSEAGTVREGAGAEANPGATAVAVVAGGEARPSVRIIAPNMIATPARSAAP
ncbi:DUF2865 domain-containing protein [Methylobacterium sp. 10]|uniref:DUF2865 domain-containing protein n=1 Tax=Methylobacterium sp. 10 TaxID=1101191 RepID=UPI00047F391C|nr:DUF2865 domain-containing protein [Methylobacterium sp. 10]